MVPSVDEAESTQQSDRQTEYPTVEHFYTIQGEGRWSGKAAYFIRLGGCDVNCPWCDTKYSWSFKGHESLSASSLASHAGASGAPMAVITGGEPTLHDMGALTEELRALGLKANLETSGAHEIFGEFDWVTLSPKTFKPPVGSAYGRADELKIVIAGESDFEWARDQAARCGPDTELRLQPEWDSEEMVPAIVDFVKLNPEWLLSIQGHKYLDVP